MKNQTYFIIDFDSTLVQLEGLDELAAIALTGKSDKAAIVQKIKAITDKGMKGSISFGDSLKARLALFRAHRLDVEALVKILKKNITPSIKRNKEFFRLYKDRIYIISGGFKDYIVPLFTQYGIDPYHVLANEFIYDTKGAIIGINEENFLAQDNGKVKQMKALKLDGTIYVLGDGYTDFQIKESGLADKFFVFCENIRRENVIAKADYILPNFDEFLYIHRLPRAYSFPKHRITIVLVENTDSGIKQIFEEEGFTVRSVQADTADKRLPSVVRNAHVLMVGESVTIGSDLVASARSLLAVGVYNEGHVDMKPCSLKGIAVFSGQPRSVAGNIAMFINTGNTVASSNFPSLSLPRVAGTHRLIHIHENKPGILARIDSALYDGGVNIEGQYLKTRQNLGYVITDINKVYNPAITRALRMVPGTIKVRVIY